MKERYILNFPPESTNKPITYRLIKNFGFRVNILRAQITPGKEGRLLLEVDANENAIQRGMQYLKREDVIVFPLEKRIKIDIDKCIHCGMCTGVCISGALTMDREEWKINLNVLKCVACELCIKACPLKLIKLNFLGNMKG